MPEQTYNRIANELQNIVQAQQRIIDALRATAADLVKHAKRADARTEALFEFVNECTRLLDASTLTMKDGLEAAIDRLAARLKRVPISDGDVEQFLKRCIEQFGGGRPVWEQRDGND